jgi:hypothetical protein
VLSLLDLVIVFSLLDGDPFGICFYWEKTKAYAGVWQECSEMMRRYDADCEQEALDIAYRPNQTGSRFPSCRFLDGRFWGAPVRHRGLQAITSPGRVIASYSGRIPVLFEQLLEK